MASMEVVVSTCDRCTTEVTTPLKRKYKKHPELVLPQGWLHIAGNTATALVFEMDLCDECKQIVLEVAGKARHVVHSTNSKTKSKGRASTKKADTDTDSDAGKAPAESEEAGRDAADTTADSQQEDNALVSIS